MNKSERNQADLFAEKYEETWNEPLFGDKE